MPRPSGPSPKVTIPMTVGKKRGYPQNYRSSLEPSSVAAKASQPRSEKRRFIATTTTIAGQTVAASYGNSDDNEKADNGFTGEDRNIAFLNQLSQSSTSATSNSNGSQTGPLHRSVPAFLNKLYSMVDESATDDYIHWSQNGKSFIVKDHKEFAKIVLPRYYKHNTFASFVRQLNMYNFHKIPAVHQGALLLETQREHWEFSNEHFRRGSLDRLALATRKRNKEHEKKSDSSSVSLAKLIRDITVIRQQQEDISTELSSLQKDNSILWQESLAAREKHQQHKEVIARILHFLTSVFSGHNITPAANSQQINGPFMLGKNNEYISLLDDAVGVLRDGKTPTAKIEEAAGNMDVKEKGAPGRFEADENLRLLKALSSALQTSYSITSPGLSTTDSTSSSAAIRYSTDSQSSASKFSSSAHTLPVCTPDHPAAAATATAAREPVNIASFSNTLDSASRSAEAITQNIEDLEADITALAEHIGIDTANLGDLFDNEDRLGDFVDGYGFMISKASRMDKIKLFELAGGSHIKNRYDESKTPQPFYDVRDRSSTKSTFADAPSDPLLVTDRHPQQSHGSAQHHRQNLMHQVPAHAHQLPSVTTAYTSPAISHSTGTNVQAPLPSSMSPRAHHEPHTQQQQKQQNTVVADNNDLHNTNFPPSFFEGGFPPNLLQPFYPVISFPSVAQGEQHQFVAVPVPVPVPYPIQHYNFPNPVPGQQPAGPSAVGGIMDGSHAPMNYLYGNFFGIQPSFYPSYQHTAQATAAQATSTSEEASQGLPESTSDPLASKAPRQ